MLTDMSIKIKLAVSTNWNSRHTEGVSLPHHLLDILYDLKYNVFSAEVSRLVLNIVIDMQKIWQLVSAVQTCHMMKV